MVNDLGEGCREHNYDDIVLECYHLSFRTGSFHLICNTAKTI
jgi:hypothetical protein